MRIFALDFTTAPRRQKPITRAYGKLDDTQLHITELMLIADFDAWESFLAKDDVDANEG